MKNENLLKVKIKILLPYIVFSCMVLIISGLSLYLRKDIHEQTIPDKCIIISSDSVNEQNIPQVIDSLDKDPREFTVQQLIFNVTNSATQYLQDSIAVDSIKVASYLKELKQLYSIKGLSDYENGILKVLIAEYEKKLKKEKSQE